MPQTGIKTHKTTAHINIVRIFSFTTEKTASKKAVFSILILPQNHLNFKSCYCARGGVLLKIEGGDFLADHFLSLGMHAQIDSVAQLAALNTLSEKYHLVLSKEGLQRLMKRRFQALKDTGRVEFGQGVLKQLVFAFCDSPYLMQDAYEETLSELQDIFYYFKNESMERLSDDELIETMAFVYNGTARGSLAYLAGTSLVNLCRKMRGAEHDEEPEPPHRGEEYDE